MEPVSRFDTLRTWRGEQSRAFEEVAYQLLKHQVPPGTRALRTGNPDGGVEWYVTLANGREWGWQAKHVKGIDALLTAMTESVERVAKERPKLCKLTFVISWNLSTGRAGKGGRERKSQRQKYEDKVKTWHAAIPGTQKIRFELVQESDLLDELAKPEHAGRREFWWGDVVFGEAWLCERFREQADAAGQKYRPDLQVDVPIQDDLLALGFDASSLAAFNRMLRDLGTAVSELHFARQPDDKRLEALCEEIGTVAQTLKETVAHLELQAGDPPEKLDVLKQYLAKCRGAISAAEDHERETRRQTKTDASANPKEAFEREVAKVSTSVRALRREIASLESWLESPVGSSFVSRAYFLTGRAGSGKTHLFLDATTRAIGLHRPAVFLSGARFGQGNLWESIADQLGLPSMGADTLLRAMDAAGEAAGLRGSRFIIFVDALNETTPAEFWRTHLPALCSAIKRFPHVALAVSCRDTYEELVVDAEERKRYVYRSHPGFAQREVEAAERYFKHYGLESPKFPLLVPEFAVPLFLRLYCESMSQSDVGRIPNGHAGRIAIFERYLEVKILAVARRLGRDVHSSYEFDALKKVIRGVIDALLDVMSNVARESLSAHEAEAAAKRVLSEKEDAAKVIGLLQEEGVLTRERLFLGKGKSEEGVRILFQAFADFLLLSRRLISAREPLRDAGLKSWLQNGCSMGIWEAAAIVFPEKYGVELPDFLSGRPETKRKRERTSEGEQDRAGPVYRSMMQMLPWREAESITKRTIELMNEAQPYLSRNEFYKILFSMAPQPGNRLNGLGLHGYLLQRRMPERDSDFGFATYREFDDEFSPASRLAQWAARGPYPKYDPRVVELACVPLCWLLGSPNRYMRDWVTKALVQLLRGHLDVMKSLVQRFWTVDDPYVVQRVVVVAYGALLRSAASEAAAARALARQVHALAFERPMRADEILLDAARGIARWAFSSGMLSQRELDASVRPYGLSAPGRPPSEKELEAKYGRKDGESDDESYSSIRWSLNSMGDFARYAVAPGVHHFSRFRIGQEYVSGEMAEPRVNPKRWKAFEASLSSEEARAFSEWLAGLREKKAGKGNGDRAIPLTESQAALLRAAFERPVALPEEYPAADACRWIFRRTLELGWTPKVFGLQDRYLDYGNGRQAHKAERWGKKYQWIAYHELLARVADNFQACRQYGNTEPYEGLHQLIADREIDPSLPPIEFRAFHERGGEGAVAWGHPIIRMREWPFRRLDFGRYQGNMQRFLDDRKSEPRANDAVCLDADGEKWVALQMLGSQVDPQAEKGYLGLQQVNSINSLLVPKADAQALLAAIGKEPNGECRWLFESQGHTDCCYWAEVGRAGPNCPHRWESPRSITVAGRSFEVAATVEVYTWEGSLLDCSIGASASVVLPSTYLQKATSLTLDPRGPCWLDSHGEVVFTYYWEPGNGSHALFVRASFLRSLLSSRGLELLLSHGLHRLCLPHDDSMKSPNLDSYDEARVSAELETVTGRARRSTGGVG